MAASIFSGLFVWKLIKCAVFPSHAPPISSSEGPSERIYLEINSIRFVYSLIPVPRTGDGLLTKAFASGRNRDEFGAEWEPERRPREILLQDTKHKSLSHHYSPP